MESVIFFFSSLLRDSFFSLFLITFTGLLFGRLKIGPFSLDVSAVLFSALLLGHFGVSLDPSYQQIGLALFIGTIGMQAGPEIIRSFKQRGFKLVMLAGITVLMGLLSTVVLARLVNLESSIALGIFSGALTSTPGLAAAIEYSSAGESTTAAYGITYLFGVLGVILGVTLLSLGKKTMLILSRS